jgi:hypothetical protein
VPIRYTIEEGDTVIALSEEHGLYSETIWNDPANEELRGLRSDMNVLAPGDVVLIPDKRQKWLGAATGAAHQFRRLGIPAYYRLQLFDEVGPRANQSFTLKIGERTYEGTTDADGVLEQYVPASAKSGQLVIGPDELRVLLEFGNLDPISEIAGVQQRLNNLGFFCGEADGEMDDDTVDAIFEFQDRYGLEATGDLDDATRAKLDELYEHPGDVISAAEAEEAES